MNKNDLIKLLFSGAALFAVGLGYVMNSFGAGLAIFGGFIFSYAIITIIWRVLEGELE
jgi:hypothetical protein